MSNTKKRNLSQKPQPSSEAQLVKIQELQTLTLADLEAISGAGVKMNHNETVVKFAHLSRKPKPSSEDKPVKGRELQTLTLADLEAISGAGLPLT